MATAHAPATGTDRAPVGVSGVVSPRRGSRSPRARVRGAGPRARGAGGPGRTEDVRLSPSGRRLAIACYLRDVVAVADVELTATADGPAMAIENVELLSSPAIREPHGVDFLDDETLVVASRCGGLGVFRLPAPGAATGDWELNPRCPRGGERSARRSRLRRRPSDGRESARDPRVRQLGPHDQAPRVRGRSSHRRRRRRAPLAGRSRRRRDLERRALGRDQQPLRAQRSSSTSMRPWVARRQHPSASCAASRTRTDCGSPEVTSACWSPTPEHRTCTSSRPPSGGGTASPTRPRRSP